MNTNRIFQISFFVGLVIFLMANPVAAQTDQITSVNCTAAGTTYCCESCIGSLGQDCKAIDDTIKAKNDCMQASKCLKDCSGGSQCGPGPNGSDCRCTDSSADADDGRFYRYYQ